MSLLSGWNGQHPTAAVTPRYLCARHQWATVADPNGPVHVRDGAVCWSIQSDRAGRTWTPQTIAETAKGVRV